MSRRSLHSQSSREGGFSANLHSPSTVRLEGFTNIFQQEGSNAAVCLFGLERSKAVSCDCYEDEGYMECCMPDVDEVDIDDDGQVPVRGVVGKAEAPILRVSFRHKRVQAEDVVIGEVTVSGKFEKLQQNILGWLRREGWEQRHRYRWRLIDQCVAEMLGTMFIVIFGVGSVCSAVLTEYNAGLWQVAVVWGFGVALAIHSTASVSGAHLNPAVSLAFAMFRPRDFGWSKLIPYWIAQYLGAIVGGCFNLLVYGPQFRHYEKVNNIVRGSKESIITASAFGEYFPNPGFDSIVGRDAISPLFAMLVEAWGTGILMFMILALIDSRHKIMKQTAMIPFFIGFTVAVLISLYAPLTQAGWNPARDFGPRIVAALAGWGRIAIPGPRNGFWIYIIGPHLGAIFGALVYDLLVYPSLDLAPVDEKKEALKKSIARRKGKSESNSVVDLDAVA